MTWLESEFYQDRGDDRVGSLRKGNSFLLDSRLYLGYRKLLESIVAHLPFTIFII
jgi:hypothetical protein